MQLKDSSKSAVLHVIDTFMHLVKDIFEKKLYFIH